MTSPALNYRTGRLARRAVRVENVTEGPRGGNTAVENIIYDQTLTKPSHQALQREVHCSERPKKD